VAQRLESMTKTLQVPLVVSASLMCRLQAPAPEAAWISHEAVVLPGRRLPVDIWCLHRETGSAHPNEDEPSVAPQSLTITDR